MEILRKITDKGGEFYILNDNKRMAEMTFIFAGEKLIIADHTWVSETEKGLGLGRKLFDELVKYARENSFKMMATCPYVLHEIKKNREQLLDILK